MPIVFKKKYDLKKSNTKSLCALRQDLDLINEDLVRLLEKRFLLIEEVLSIKTKEALPLRDADRETQCLKNINIVDSVYDAPIKTILQCIFDESYKFMFEKQNTK